mgnify:CR=1 FL=1
MRSKKSCKDCGSGTRKLPYPGPRCGQCHRAVKASRKDAAHELYVLKTYGLKAGQYQALYEAQGGVCFICRRATGKVRKLAVDHDHATGYVRGLLCKPCNSVLAHFRDDEAVAWRAYDYLMDGAPAPDVIGWVKPDDV